MFSQVNPKDGRGLWVSICVTHRWCLVYTKWNIIERSFDRSFLCTIFLAFSDFELSLIRKHYYFTYKFLFDIIIIKLRKSSSQLYGWKTTLIYFPSIC